MRALVVYESSFGNTEQVARALARGIGETMEVDVVAAGRATVALRGFDLVVAGGPTHAFSMSRAATRAEAAAAGGDPGEHDQGLREWLIRLEHVNHSVRAAAFDTRQTSVRHLPGSAAHAAGRLLRAHGFAMAAPPTSFYVTGRQGPLVDGELERAEELGRTLAAGSLSARGAGSRRR